MFSPGESPEVVTSKRSVVEPPVHFRILESLVQFSGLNGELASLVAEGRISAVLSSCMRPSCGAIGRWTASLSVR